MLVVTADANDYCSVLKLFYELKQTTQAETIVLRTKLLQADTKILEQKRQPHYRRRNVGA